MSLEWICNVCATVLEEDFTDWVTEQVENRNIEVVESKELNIEMDPEIFAAFQASTAVSRKYLFSSSSLIIFYRSFQGTVAQPLQDR